MNLNFLVPRWMRKEKAIKVPVKIPAIGEKWLFRGNDESPWGAKPGLYPVTILDVRNGWVRYYMFSLFRDERMKIDLFIKLYVFHTADERIE